MKKKPKLTRILFNVSLNFFLYNLCMPCIETQTIYRSMWVELRIRLARIWNQTNTLLLFEWTKRLHFWVQKVLLNVIKNLNWPLPCTSCHQGDGKYRVLAFLQVGQKNFGVTVPAQMQLLRVFAIGKKLDWCYKVWSCFPLTLLQSN